MKNFSKVFRLGITDNQLDDFIDAVVETIDKSTMNKVLSKLDDDVTTIYNAALNPVKNEQVLSEDKFESKLFSLTSQLDDYILELGDEDGEYFGSENHWECPEFNEYQFSRDIEEVFEKMLPLLNDAHKYESIEDDYFINLIEEINDGIGAYPEWSGSDYSDWGIEKYGAQVIFKWMWLNKNTIPEFIETAYTTMNDINHSFDPTFIHKLTDNEKQELYIEIEKHKDEWKSDLENTKSFLHNMFHIVSQIGNKDGFIKASIANIANKWHYGIDVYEYYLDNNDYQNAEIYIQQTITEFYRQSSYGSINLNIQQIILALHRNETDERIDEVFENWLEVLDKLNDNLKHKLVTVQYQAYLNPNDYTNLLDVIIKNKTQFYDNYISDVKLSFTKKSSSATEDSWLGYLIDFAIDKNENIFIDKTKLWLLSNFNHSYDYDLLMILSNDLLSFISLEKYPIFYKHIENNNSSKIDSFRKKFLADTNTEKLEEFILKAWQNNIEIFIPSPNDVYKANYASHAKWLAITKEISQEVYDTVYHDWRINQYRKINLWRELTLYGITK